MRRGDDGFAGPGIMLLSAVVFGYFGFVSGLGTVSPVTGQPVLMWQMLVWTLRISAVGFAVAGGLAFAAPWPANLLYAVVGLVGALLFVTILVIDYFDKQHASSAFLLLIFALWNGYGSWTGLRALFAARPAQRGADRPEPREVDR